MPVLLQPQGMQVTNQAFGQASGGRSPRSARGQTNLAMLPEEPLSAQAQRPVANGTQANVSEQSLEEPESPVIRTNRIKLEFKG